MPGEELVKESDGRMRRRAVFNDNEKSEEEDDRSSDEDGEGGQSLDVQEDSDEEITLNFDAQKHKRGAALYENVHVPFVLCNPCNDQ